MLQQSFSQIIHTVSSTVYIEIALGALKNQLFTRLMAFVAWKRIFHFLNQSNGMWVKVIFVSNTKLVAIWVFPKNTFEMSGIIAIFTVIEPMLWVLFFFTDIAIIFPRVIFKSTIQNEGMLMLFVPYG